MAEAGELYSDDKVMRCILSDEDNKISPDEPGYLRIEGKLQFTPIVDGSIKWPDQVLTKGNAGPVVNLETGEFSLLWEGQITWQDFVEYRYDAQG